MDYLRFGGGSEPLVILLGLSMQSVMGAADAVEEAYAPLAGDFTIYLLDQRKNLPNRFSPGKGAVDSTPACSRLVRCRAQERIHLYGRHSESCNRLYSGRDSGRGLRRHGGLGQPAEVADWTYFVRTMRCYKIPGILEDLCEQYYQYATYQGGIEGDFSDIFAHLRFGLARIRPWRRVLAALLFASHVGPPSLRFA